MFRFCIALVSITLFLLTIAPFTLAQSAQVLFSFDQTTGSGWSQLIADSSGNLYGTGEYTATNCGSAFMLSRNANGSWNRTALHTFGSAPDDGCNPNGGLVMDQAGNLYGSTCGGGAYGLGTIYELTSNGNGAWTEKLVFPFQTYGQLCYSPDQDTLALDTAGNLYGVNAFGGSEFQGNVFQLSPQPNGNKRFFITSDIIRTVRLTDTFRSPVLVSTQQAIFTAQPGKAARSTLAQSISSHRRAEGYGKRSSSTTSMAMTENFHLQA